MIFVTLAIGRGVSAPRERSNCPESRSARTATGALSAGAVTASAGVCSTEGNGESDPSGGTGVAGGGDSAASANGLVVNVPSARTTSSAISAPERDFEERYRASRALLRVFTLLVGPAAMPA